MKSKPPVIGVNICRNTSKGSKTWSGLLLGEAKKFSFTTALHGYRFIVLPKRILLERVIWLTICLSSVISVVSILCMAWRSLQENPIVSMTESITNPVWNYEFPAVTLCNYNKISRTKVFKLARNLTVTNGRSPLQLIRDLRLLFQLINNDGSEIPTENYTRVANLLRDNRIGVDQALRAVAPSCEDMLLRCKWKGEEKRCDAIFEQVRTSRGFCCTFNYFALKNDSFGGKFTNKAPKRPRRVSSCGYQTGLDILLDNNPEDYFATDIPSIGYRIFVHNPHYFPNDNLQNVPIAMKTINYIGVNPRLIYATDNLRYIATSLRHCHFQDERVLASYQQYNYHNCVVECKRNMTVKFCGCVPFQYSHLEGDDQIVCSPEHISCLAEHQPLIERCIPGVNLSTAKDSYEAYGWQRSECSCLPDCEISDYLSESSWGELDRRHSTNDPTLFGSFRIENQSVVRVFYSDLVSKKIRWDVVFNWHALLAYYGGLLGLFVGFSFVSFLEIIYFFIVRLLLEAAKCRKIHLEPRSITGTAVLKTKIVVQPVAYRSLQPNQLNIPSDTELQRFRMNSYFFW